MSENLFEAWGALQGSLQRLGDAVLDEAGLLNRYGVKGTPFLDAYDGHVELDYPTMQALENYYQAHRHYQELTKGKS